MFPLTIKIEANKNIITGVSLYQNNLKNWNFGCAKTNSSGCLGISDSGETLFIGNPSETLIAQVHNFLKNYPRSPLPQLDWNRLSPFSSKVLKALLQIPCGSVCTYKEIAEKIGHPLGARAVGQACSNNPFPFLIPCHRVVSSQGLGGFLFGIECKKNLLNYEKAIVFS